MRPLHAPIEGVRARCLLGLDIFWGVETGFGVRSEHLGFGPGNERLRLHEGDLLLHQADTGLHLGEDLRERAELVDLAEQLLKFSFHRQSFHFDTEDTGPAYFTLSVALFPFQGQCCGHRFKAILGPSI